MSVGILQREYEKSLVFSVFVSTFYFHLAEEHPPVLTGSSVSASPKFSPPEAHRGALLTESFDSTG